MPLCMDTQAGVAASGTVANAIVPFTPNVGDSFQVRNFALTSTCELDIFSGHLLQGNPIRLRSPMLHDNVQGLRFDALTVDPTNLLAQSFSQQLIAQDILIAELVVATAPGVTENEVAVIGYYYDDLPGATARLYNPGDITPNIKNLWSVPVTVTTSAAAGVWASAAVNSTYDLFQANTDYAVIGYEVDTVCAAIAIRGPDTSNFRCGAPGITDRYKTRQHFADVSMMKGKPHIPVFNSANKSATFVDVSSRTTATATTVTLVLAELTNAI